MRNSDEKLLSMQALSFSHKTIKVFCITSPADQKSFEEYYNDKDTLVTILRDYFDKDGTYYIAAEIRKIKDDSSPNEFGEGKKETEENE